MLGLWPPLGDIDKGETLVRGNNPTPAWSSQPGNDETARQRGRNATGELAQDRSIHQPTGQDDHQQKGEVSTDKQCSHNCAVHMDTIVQSSDQTYSEWCFPTGTHTNLHAALGMTLKMHKQGQSTATHLLSLELLELAVKCFEALLGGPV